jgi:chromate transporter
MMNSLIQLFKSFFIIGAGAYGGGLVTIPLIHHEIVLKQNWIDFEKMTSLLAVSQMTPGPIAVNSATFVGFRIGSGSGSIVATIGVLLPSMLIMMVVAGLLERMSKNRHIERIRQGFQIGVLSLILFATWNYGSAVISGWQELAMGIAAFSFLIAFEGRFHPVFVILSCGIIGIFIF